MLASAGLFLVALMLCAILRSCGFFALARVCGGRGGGWFAGLRVGGCGLLRVLRGLHIAWSALGLHIAGVVRGLFTCLSVECWFIADLFLLKTTKKVQ